MKVLLINLDRSTERLRQIKQQLEQLNISFERVAAIDANTLSDQALDFVKTPNFEYPYPLTKGEIACFLSHRKCWELIVSSNEDWTLVLEDNALISPRIVEYIANSEWIPKECELIQLTYTDLPTYTNKVLEVPHNTLMRTEYSSPFGTSAYLISKKVASIALEHSKVLQSPVDNFLFSSWSSFSKSISFWRLKTPVVKRNNVNSTITDRNKATKTWSLYRCTPKRLLTKIHFKLHRRFLQKEKQTWI